MAANAEPLRRAVLGAIATLVWVGAAAAAAPRVTVTGAWMRPARAMTNGVGYLAISNHGRLTDTLIAVASPAATRVSIHQSRMVGALMTMRRLPVLAIPPGATVILAPGGLHLMLENLRRPLTTGDQTPMVLTFARAGGIRVVFPVRPVAPSTIGMRM